MYPRLFVTFRDKVCPGQKDTRVKRWIDGCRAFLIAKVSIRGSGRRENARNLHTSPVLLAKSMAGRACQKLILRVTLTLLLACITVLPRREKNDNATRGGRERARLLNINYSRHCGTCPM